MPEPPYLKLMGGADLEIGSDRSSSDLTARHHPMALLAVLAVRRSRSMSRGRLAGLLWPESPEKNARGRLNSCVYTVRSELGDALLLSTGDDLELDGERLEVDVWRFEAALESDDLETAVELYGGPFLEGFSLDGAPGFEKWLDRERSRLRRRYHEALEGLAEAAEARGEPEAAARWWGRRVEEEPHDSRAVRRLMKAEAAAGNRPEALWVARKHEEFLREELGLEPDPSVGELAAELRQESASEAEELELGREVPVAELEDGRESGYAAARGPVRGEPSRWRTPAVAAAVVAAVVVAGAVSLGVFSDPAPPGEPASRVPTIAVLAFEAVGQEEGGNFAEGLHGDLITRLAGVSGLRIVSATSTRRYGGADLPVSRIADSLSAGWILEGEVQRAGDEVKVNAQLIDARTDSHAWAKSYRRELTARNLFRIQEDLSRRIVGALEVELTPGDERQLETVPTESTAAYELYLQARGLERQEQVDPARQERLRTLLWRAVELDSAFAGAWAELADLYAFRQPDSARMLATRALRLNPDLANGHTQLGDAQWALGDTRGALEAYRRALDLEPSHREAAQNLVTLLARQGRLAEKARWLDRLRRIAPEEPSHVGRLLELNVVLGREEVAAAWRDYARERGWELVRREFDLALFHRGDVGRARELLPKLDAGEEGRSLRRRRAALSLYAEDWDEARRRYRALYPGVRAGSSPIFLGLLSDRIGLAWALGRSGHPEEAREIAAEVDRDARSELEDASTPSLTVHARHRLPVARLIQGDTAGSLEHLETSVEEGYRGRGILEHAPTLAPLRSNPRFRALLDELRGLLSEERRRVERAGWAEPPDRRLPSDATDRG